MSNIAEPTLLSLPDGELSNSKEAYSKIKDYVKKVNPDFIITHDEKDYHPDHRALSRIISDIASFKYQSYMQKH